MKKLLRTVCVLCAVTVLFLLAGCAEEKAAVPEPTERFFINDFAEVITAEDADAIFSAGAALDAAVAAKLQKTTGAQVVAVTVETTGGEEPGEYALAIGRAWGPGDKDDNNGIVILLATEDREIYVSVGDGLEGALPDSKVGRIIDNYGYDYFAENEFSAGMKSLYTAIVREVYAEYELDVPEDIAQPERYSPDVDYDEAGISWGFIILIIALCIIYSRLRRLPFMFFGGHSGRGGFGGFGGGFGGFGGSGGGFGGFSGGGGGFSGGGAGRGF